MPAHNTNKQTNLAYASALRSESEQIVIKTWEDFAVGGFRVKGMNFDNWDFGIET